MFVTQGEMKNTVSLMLGLAMKHPVMKKKKKSVQFFSSSFFIANVPKFFFVLNCYLNRRHFLRSLSGLMQVCSVQIC